MLIVIEGVVLPDKRKFRPSDWAEMLIEGVGLASFGPNHKIHYADDVEPATINGCASIIFDEALEQSHPDAYAELLHFATKNNLNIFVQEGTISHGDGLAGERKHHANQNLQVAAEDKKDLTHANHDELRRLVDECITLVEANGSNHSGENSHDLPKV